MQYLVERFTAPGIAHHSYLLGSGRAAAVIDPSRDWWTYTDRAAELGMEIRYIFETHRNEDYVVGSSDLVRETGARVFHGSGLDFTYGETLEDGDEFRLGILKIRALATPGHTPESFSYALIHPDAGEEAVAVFTGDALFVGEVGRTDFYPERRRELAEALYHSIHDKILPLGDGTILYPAHGAGSACGNSISERNDSTLGLEREQSPMLSLPKEEFVAHKMNETLPIPPYFRLMEKYNLHGGPEVMNRPRPRPLSPTVFRELAEEEGTLVLDCRLPPAFGAAHVPGSISIWREGLASFAGWVLPSDARILLVIDELSGLEEAVTSLMRVGYDRIEGYLDGGMEFWYNAGFQPAGTDLRTAADLKEMVDEDSVEVLDIRRPDERAEGYIPGSRWIFVGELLERMEEVPRGRPIALVCNVGNRGSLGTSLMLRAGYTDVMNILGGMTAWNRLELPTVRDAE